MHSRRIALVALALLGGCSRTFPPITSPTTRTPPAPLEVNVYPQTIAPLGSSQVVPSGGVPPYFFTLLSTDEDGGPEGALLDGGEYLAGPTGPAQISIKVTDSDGGARSIGIEVGLPLVLDPPSATVPPGGATTFFAQYGQPPYRYLLDPRSACPTSTVDAGYGYYQAGRSCGGGTDYVIALDANDAGSELAQVSITPGPQISPSSVTLSSGQALDFSVGGGSPPYSFGFAPHGDLSGGTLTPDGRYQSGPNPNEVDTIQVVDASGLTFTSQIGVGNRVYPLAQAAPYQVLALPVQRGGALALSWEVLAYSVGLGTSAGDVELLVGSPAGLQLRQSLPQPTPICQAFLLDVNGDGLLDVALNEAGFSGDCAGAEGLGTQNFATGGSTEILLGQPDGTLGAGLAFTAGGAADDGGLLNLVNITAPVPISLPGAAGDDLVSVEYDLEADGGFGDFLDVFGLDTQGSIALKHRLFIPVSPLFGPAPPSSDRQTNAAFAQTLGLGELGLVVLGNLSLGGDGGLNVASPVVLPLGQFGVGAAPLSGWTGIGMPFAYTLDPYVGGTLVAFPPRPDGGFAPAQVATLAPGAQLSTASFSAPFSLSSLTQPEELVEEAGTLTPVDAGLLPCLSIAEGLFSAADVIDRVSTSVGLLTEQAGVLPSGFATGNAFRYPIPANRLGNWLYAVGDLDGDGHADVVVGGQGFSVFTGAEAGLSTEGTWLSEDDVEALVASPSGFWALATPLGSPTDLVRIASTDGGGSADGGAWEFTRFQLVDAGFTPQALLSFSAGGEIPGGDLVVWGAYQSGWGFQAYRVSNGVPLPSPSLFALFQGTVPDDSGNTQALGPPAPSGAPPPPNVAAAIVGDGGVGELALAVQVGDTLYSDTYDLIAPIGVGAVWSVTDAGPGYTETVPALGCQTNAYYGIVPLPLAPGQLASRWLTIQSADGLVFADGGLFEDADGGSLGPSVVCVFDPTSGAVPTPTGAGYWGQDYADFISNGSPAVGDLNGDGLNDLVLITDNGMTLSFGLGNYQFSPPVPLVDDGSPISFLGAASVALAGFGDVNGDGYPDLVMANTLESALFVLYGLPDGGLY